MLLNADGPLLSFKIIGEEISVEVAAQAREKLIEAEAGRTPGLRATRPACSPAKMPFSSR